MKKHFDIKISGKVQGVFFRVSAKKEADELGLFGFTRNESDGTVYIEIEGDEEKIKEFLKWCKNGSINAIVKNIKFEKSEIKNYSTFEIKF